MEKIIKAAVDRGASDLHIKAGDVFRAREIDVADQHRAVLLEKPLLIGIVCEARRDLAP